MTVEQRRDDRAGGDPPARAVTAGGAFEPRDLSARLAAQRAHRPEVSPPAGAGAVPFSAARAAPESAAPAGHDSRDRRAHAIARSLLASEETCRLYPRGHKRIRQALKQCLQHVQEYCLETGRPFLFVPDAALDTLAIDKGRVARDVSAFAYHCRVHLIAELEIGPEVDLDELEQLVRFLQSRPGLPSDSCGGPVPLLQWKHIRVEAYDPEADQERYHFRGDGEQVLPGAASGGGDAGLAMSRPVRRKFVQVLRDPEIEACLDRLRAHLGLERVRIDRENAPAPEGNVDLATEVLRQLLKDSSFSADAPLELLRNKVSDFLRTLETAVASLRETSSRPLVHDPGGVASLLDRVAGLCGSRAATCPEPTAPPSRPAAVQAGEALFQESAIGAGISLRANLPRGTEPVHGASFPTLQAGPDSSGLEGPEERDPFGAPEKFIRALPELDSVVLPSFEDIFRIQVDPRDVARDLQEIDCELELLQVDRDLMSLALEPERFHDRRRRYLERLGARKWPEPEAFLVELDGAVDALASHPLERPGAIIEDAFGAERSQRLFNLYLERRIGASGDPGCVRSLLEEVAKNDVLRVVDALSTLWKAADKDTRGAYIDEVFRLPLDVTSLGQWARRHPLAFTSERSLEHLKTLPPARLREVLVRLLSTSQRGGAKTLPAIAALLKSAGAAKDGEGLLRLALRKGTKELRLEALGILESCTSGQTIDVVARILEHQNTAAEPDLHEVRLALTALLRSPRAEARDLVRRVESERKLMRHVYRREIRDILALLKKVEQAPP